MTDNANDGNNAPQGEGGANAEPLPQPVTTATSQPDPEPEVAKPEAPIAPVVKPPRDYARERLQERIDRLTAKVAEKDRELALARTAAPDQARIQAEITAEAAKLAQSKAEEIAAWNAFTGQINTAIEEGRREFGEDKFNASVEALRGLHVKDDPEVHGKYLSMLQAVLDTGAAPKVLAVLGEDPNEAARIMGLTPTKMGVELGRLAFRDAEQVSGAPKPIKPVTSIGKSHVAIAPDDPERSDGIADMRVWMERRTQQVNEVNKRAGRRILI